VPASLIETGLRDATLAGYALVAIAGTIIVLTVIALTVVLGSTMRLTVALRRRSYALWQTVGVPPSHVRTIVLSQLLVIAVVGAVIGSLVGFLLIPALVEQALQGSNGVDSFRLFLSPSTAAMVVGATVLIVLMVGDPGARRAGRTRPLEVLRESPVSRRPRLWPRVVTAAGIIAVVVQMLSGLPGSALSGNGSAAILVGPLLVAATATLGPVVFRPLMRLWTSLVPASLSAAWYVARANTLYALDRSSTVIASLVVAVALPSSFAAGQGTLSNAMTTLHGSDAPQNAGGTLLLILGGPVLLAAAGAAAATVMSSGARSREAALLSAAGSPPGFSISIALLEGVIQIVTAVILGIAIVLLTGGSEAVVLSAVAPGVNPDFAWATLGFTVALTATGILLATLIPTLLAARQIVPRALNG
jgi:putative ABC transport system permease protein